MHGEINWNFYPLSVLGKIIFENTSWEIEI